MTSTIKELQKTVELLKQEKQGTYVAFDAYVKSTASDIIAPRVIKYDAFRAEIGGGMNLATGVFTAPIGGIYAFTGTWNDAYTSTSAYVYLLKNGEEIGVAAFADDSDRGSFGLSVMLELAQGDEISTELVSGVIHSFIDVNMHFTGQLLLPLFSQVKSSGATAAPNPDRILIVENNSRFHHRQ